MSQAGQNESRKRAAAAERKRKRGIDERVAKLGTLLPPPVEEGTDDEVLLMERIVEHIKDKKIGLAELVRSIVASLPGGESSTPFDISLQGYGSIRTPEELMTHLLRTKREKTFQFFQSIGLKTIRYKDST